MRGDKLELGEWLRWDGHDLVVEEAKGVESHVPLVSVLVKVDAVLVPFAGPVTAVEMAQDGLRILQKDAALQHAAEDAAVAEPMLDFVWGYDGRVEALAASFDDVGLKSRVR